MSPYDRGFRDALLWVTGCLNAAAENAERDKGPTFARRLRDVADIIEEIAKGTPDEPNTRASPPR